MHECGPLLRIDEWMLVSGGEEEKKKNAVHWPASGNGGEMATGDERRLNVQESAVIFKVLIQERCSFFCLILFFARLEAKRFKQTKKKHKHLIFRFITGQYSGNIIKMPLNFKGEQINFNTQL